MYAVPSVAATAMYARPRCLALCDNMDFACKGRLSALVSSPALILFLGTFLFLPLQIEFFE